MERSEEKPRSRLPLLLPGGLALLLGLATGLVRLGWAVPLPSQDWLQVHGPLMVGGFLGTVIGLERAVALGRPAAYLAPALCGLGGLLHLLPIGTRAGSLTIAAGGVALVVTLLGLRLRRPGVSATGLVVAALAFVVGFVLRAGNEPVFLAVPWWISFLILTIAAERLELARILAPSRRQLATLYTLATLLLVGAALHTTSALLDKTGAMRDSWLGEVYRSPGMSIGARLQGAALLGLALWLLSFDLIKPNLRLPGLPRYIALCLSLGYVWLLVAGTLGLLGGAFVTGPGYDALLHAVFLGFTFSMILAHAPVILPGVLGIDLDFRKTFYLPLALLHATLLLRITGDILGNIPLRQWGGLGNVIALLAFLVSTAHAARRRV